MTKTKITCLKGPLDHEWLAHIARLYGHYDPKYGSVEFCRYIFNNNPHGYSLHVFAVHHSGEVIGHYGLIPLTITEGESRRLSGKGEAFVVRSDYRDASIIQGNKDVLIGLALPRALYRFARQQGIPIIHLISSERIGFIHRKAGCRHVIVEEQKYFFLNFSRRKETLKNIRWNILGCAQNILYYFWKPLLPGKRKKLSCIPGSSITPQQVKTISGCLNIAGKDDKWGLAMDAETLAWYMKVGLFDIITSPYDAETFAVIRTVPRESVEVVAAHVPGTSYIRGLQLLKKIVKHGKAHKAPIVFFTKGALFGNARKVFPGAGYILGFLKKHAPTGLYLKAGDSNYLDGSRLRFSPFFYAAF